MAIRYASQNPTRINAVNDGASLATAFNTVAQANAALAAGNVSKLYIDPTADFACDAPFVLPAAANGVTVDSASGSQRAHVHWWKSMPTWTKTAGRTNIYESTDAELYVLLFERDAANVADYANGQGRVWLKPMIGANFAAVAASMDTTPGACYVDPATTKIYMTPSTLGQNPNSNGLIYERARGMGAISNHCIDGTAVSGANIQNLIVGGAPMIEYTTGGEPTGGRNHYNVALNPKASPNTMTNCLLYHGDKHVFGSINGETNGVLNINFCQAEQGNGVLSSSGTSTVWNFYADEGANPHVRAMTATMTGCWTNKNISVANSYAGSQNGDWGATVYTHTDNAGQVQWLQITVSNCQFPGQSLGQAGLAITNGVVFTGGRLGIASCAGKFTAQGVYFDLRLIEGNAGGVAIARNCMFVPTGVMDGSKTGCRIYAGANVTLEGCTFDMRFRNTASQTACYYRQGACALTYRANLFIQNTTNSLAQFFGAFDFRADTVVSDYNRWMLFTGQSNIAYFCVDSTGANSQRTLAQWQTAMGQDANSTVVVGATPPATYDAVARRPKASSPLIGAATVASLAGTADFYGVLRPASGAQTVGAAVLSGGAGGGRMGTGGRLGRRGLLTAGSLN